MNKTIFFWSQEKRYGNIEEMINLMKIFFATNQLELSDMIKKRKWSKFLKQLSLDPNQVNSPNRKESILHEVCRFQPPLKVVRKIIKMNPTLLNDVNFQGRLPLHIATVNGASFDVVLYLCECNPTAAGLQDLQGKTPLHLLVGESPYRILEKTLDEFMLEALSSQGISRIVRVLVNASPETVNLEDISGMSALDYAVNFVDDIDVINELQRASIKEWRSRSKQGKKHTCNVNDNIQKQYQLIALCEDLDSMKYVVSSTPPKWSDLNITEITRTKIVSADST